MSSRSSGYLARWLVPLGTTAALRARRAARPGRRAPYKKPWRNFGRAALGAALGGLFSVVVASASAAASTDDARERASAAADPALPEGTARRQLPDYGARAPEPGWQAVALFVPRLLLAPVYVATDLVAQPLMALGAFAEKHHIPERVREIVTFGPEQRMALYPIAWLDLGFRPTVGAQFTWNRPGPANDVRLRATTGGSGRWIADASFRLPLGALGLRLDSRVSQRDDAAFYGLGGASAPRATRLRARGEESELALEVLVGPRLRLTSSILHEWWSFGPAPSPSSSPLAVTAASPLPAPPAFAGGVLALGAGVRLEHDSRRGRILRRPRQVSDHEHVSGSGVAWRAQLAQHVGLRRTSATASEPARQPAWLSYAAVVTGTLDVTGTQRRLELELYAAAVDPWPGAGDVPFIDLVSLGGARLRGFVSRRLIDRSAAVSTVRYRWPIWSELDGTLHYAVGNVFGSRWRGIGLERSRASFGLGIASATSSDHMFELLLAFGSETFAQGGAIESTRFAAGWNADF